MRYHALACDYDGTLAEGGRMSGETAESLKRLRASGRKVLMVTGRELDNLLEVCPEIDLFHSVVAENGAVIYQPATRTTKLLAEHPGPAFIDALRARGVTPLSGGRVIVSTHHPQEGAVLDVIRELGLELQLIFNKGSVMILPTGINKATGLGVALDSLGLSPRNAVGVGDAENDHALLSLCECAAAVANALPHLKERADLVTAGSAGAGVGQLCDALVENDLAEVAPRLSRHDIPLGVDAQGQPVALPAYGVSVLIAGTSGGGKSTVATGLLERMDERRYQYCIVDPEGDYADYPGAVALGGVHHPPDVDEMLDLLDKPPYQNVSLNLLDVGLDDRPSFFDSLFPRLQERRARTGRPHWIVVDEIHHLLPAGWDPAKLTVSRELHGLLLITVHPEKVSPVILQSVDVILAIGAAPAETIGGFARALGEAPPPLPDMPLETGEAIAWYRRRRHAPFWLRSIPPRRERRRHLRKYAEGDLGPDKSFFFRGPRERLHLRAQNLTLFLQLGDGVDDATWLFHLRRGDYSRWMREAIKDLALAGEIADIERVRHPSAAETRSRVRAVVERRYTGPA